VDELADVTIEISVLSPFRRVTDVEQIEVGTHGLMVFEGNHQGLLLPQVPVEQGWDRTEFLGNDQTRPDTSGASCEVQAPLTRCRGFVDGRIEDKAPNKGRIVAEWCVEVSYGDS